MKNICKILVTLTTLLLLAACTPEVGSPEWCKMMKEKEKGDWTINEGKDYLNYCVLKNKKED